jgi:hypothetical protein
MAHPIFLDPVIGIWLICNILKNSLEGFGIHSFINGFTVSFLVPGRFFSFIILYTVHRTLAQGISSSQDRYIHKGQHKDNKRKQISMPRVGFEPMIPVFERARIVHTLDRAGNVLSWSGWNSRLQFRTSYTLMMKLHFDSINKGTNFLKQARNALSLCGYGQFAEVFMYLRNVGNWINIDSWLAEGQ